MSMLRSSRKLAICATAAVLSAAVFCLVLLYAGIVPYQSESPLQHFAVLYLPLALISILLLFALKLRVEHSANLALVIISTLLTFYLIELFLTLGPRPNIAREVAKQLGKSFDPRTRLQVVEDLRRNGIKAYPHVSGPQLSRLALEVGGKTILPLSPGISRATIVFCNETGNFVTYQSDEHGFNNPLGLWGRAVVDVVLIGDSFTHGFCVESGVNLAARVRARWPTVLNLGVSGAGPLLELAVLREFAVPVQPRVVLWIFYEGNDFFDMKEENDNQVLHRYLSEKEYTQRVIEHQTVIDERLSLQIDAIIQDQDLRSQLRWSWSEWGDQLLSIARLRNVRTVMGIYLPEVMSDVQISPLSEIMERAKETVSSWGGKLYFVYLPTYERYTQRVGEGVPGRKKVLALMSKLNIPIIDMHEKFISLENPKAYWVHPQGHYTVKGYAVVAEAIAEALAREPSLTKN